MYFLVALQVMLIFANCRHGTPLFVDVGTVHLTSHRLNTTTSTYLLKQISVAYKGKEDKDRRINWIKLDRGHHKKWRNGKWKEFMKENTMPSGLRSSTIVHCHCLGALQIHLILHVKEMPFFICWYHCWHWSIRKLQF